MHGMHGIGDNFDPTYISHEAGRSEGEHFGRKVGFQQGQQAGYNAGHADGYDEGYSAGREEAVARGNAEMLKQMAYTRQHIAEKEELAKQLRDQAILILRLQSRLEEMERENINLKKSNEDLHQVVTALKDANERLQTQVAKLDEQYKTRTQEYSDHVWQYNRNMVFMNAVRSTLEELTAGNGAQARHVREIFAQKYGESVSKALAHGSIKIAPEKDETFAKRLPKTQQFILDMLGNVAATAPQPIRERMMTQVQTEPTDQTEDEHSLGM